MNKFKKIGQSGKILLFLFLVYSVTSHNPFETAIAVLVPFILMPLLWKRNESPFLFLGIMLQWASINIKVFYANFEGLKFEDVFDNYQHIQEAFFYSNIGLISIALGVFLIVKRYELKDQGYAHLALSYDSRKIIPIYIIISLVYPFISEGSFNFGGLQQPISKLADFKWMVFFIFMLSCLYTKQFKLFTIIALAEVVISLTGFFSSFKDYFLVVFGGIVVIYSKDLKFKQVLPLAAITVSLVYMMIIWQYVKPDYRSYLSGGQLNQNVIRSTGESLGKLGELIKNVDDDAINSGFKQTVDRLSYIDFFSATIDYVPRVVPHTHGRLWGDAIGRVLQPRIFFPDKAAIDDSETTRTYSGIMVAGTEQGASISLGYMTENYIDFGMPGMFISLFIYGLVVGLVYKYVMTSSPNKLIGTAMIIPLFILFYLFESALNKLIGGLLMYLLIYELIRRFALKKFLQQIKI
ncbi:hypothetical protein EA772_10935 [Pedobacter sp. G11]|uniref:hypothetical protein n=1 Tax=Pedobacter sp. G11 TaxID=2482728 RepID=UPI000F600AA8|nr:hypothetical protein [Pedobacter sp. G11]AZI25830.1 hypothetical protein EA772_10935 [Pedobacter sp. G11]